MPNVQAHDRIAIASGLVMVPLSGAAWMVAGSTPTEAAINTAVLVGSHLACSYWLSPDLDIDSAIDNRWGPLGFIWKPYERLVPHRHWLSHSGLSVLLRLLYLLVPLGVLLFLISLVYPDPMHAGFAWLVAKGQDHPEILVLLLVGAVFSDLLHTISDHLSTTGKRCLRCLRRSRRSRRSRRPERRRHLLRRMRNKRKRTR
jgi:uncharacterized metal-binding protein